MRRYYFPDFEREAYHILYTLSKETRLGTTEDMPTFIPSEWKFQIVPFLFDDTGAHYAEGISGGYKYIYSRNAIVFGGVVAGSTMPSNIIPDTSSFWIAGSHDALPHSTLAISHRIFLQTYILEMLSEVNLNATFAVSLTGVDRTGKWRLGFISWSEHQIHQDDDIVWQPVPYDKSYGYSGKPMRFEWNAYDASTHEKKWSGKPAFKNAVTSAFGGSCSSETAC